jgi:NADH-quinone oxidoreductase subunit J
MTTDLILFAILASWTGISALAVVFARNIVRAAVYLLFTLIGVALTYFLLGAEFLGASQLIVYVGGTLVLVIFGVMLTASGPFLRLRTPPGEYLVAGAIAAALFALLVMTSLKLGERPLPRTPEPNVAVGELGMAFLSVPDTQRPTDAKLPQPGYLLPFEIVSVHLLVVLIGAAYLARAKRRSKPVTGESS